MKITQITGNKYYEEDNDYQIIIIPSGTREYYHVIIDSAYDNDNQYFHFTKIQVKEKFNIIISL